MRLATLPLALLALAGCSLGGEDASLERRELGRLVLQPDDLPRVFVRFDEGREVVSDSRGARRSDPARFSRVAGWKARYRRAGAVGTSGALVVESRVELFESASGAKAELDAARSDIREVDVEWKPISEPGLGDESFAATSVQVVARVRRYRVFWREDNATASLSVKGLEGKLALADALELARKQQRRLAQAAA